MGSIANTLPFDVLCAIFEHYVVLDRPSQPQARETLLLVSRTWHTAASNHSILWANVDLCITYWREMEYWTSCVARRLARYSANALLEIRITMFIYTYHVAEEVFARKASENLLLTLVGGSGTVARRWRRFVLVGAFAHITPTTLAHCLSFPTPNLQEFSISSVRCDREILPYSPALKLFLVDNCILPKFPNLETVTDLRLEFMSRTRSNKFDEHAVALARNLQSLKIRTTEPYKLSATYPHLKTLDLQGAIYEDCLTDFCAPNLNDLSLTISYKRDYLSVVSCVGIQLKNVKTARLGVQELTRGTVPAYLDGVRQFLTHLVSLETLRLHDSVIGHLALRLLTEDCKHLYQSQTLHLVWDEHSIELGKGESRLSSVDTFRQQTGCLESDGTNILLNALSVLTS